MELSTSMTNAAPPAHLDAIPYEVAHVWLRPYAHSFSQYDDVTAAWGGHGLVKFGVYLND